MTGAEEDLQAEKFEEEKIANAKRERRQSSVVKMDNNNDDGGGGNGGDDINKNMVVSNSTANAVVIEAKINNKVINPSSVFIPSFPPRTSLLMADHLTLPNGLLL
jgi:hypothetical protein